MIESENTNNHQFEGGENPQTIMNATLIFAKALGLMLKESEGIVINLEEEIKLDNDSKKVIVFNFQNQVHIYKCEEDLEEGTVVNMTPTVDNSSI